MKYKNKIFKNKGFTLVEVLLIVGFISVATTGVYGIYDKVETSAKAYSESVNLDVIRVGVKSVYGARNNYGNPSAVSNVILNQAKITPRPMMGNEISRIKNSFGGEVVISPISLGSGTNNGFRIRYENVPRDVCTKLAVLGANKFNRVIVNSMTVKNIGDQTVDPSLSAIACTSSGPTTLILSFDSM